MDRRLAGEKERLHIFRPRIVAYMAVLVLVSAIMVGAFATRGAIDLNVLRDRNPLFVQLSNGSIRNGYAVKIINKLHDEQLFSVRLEGLEGAQLVQQGHEPTDNLTILVGPDSLKDAKTFVVLPRASLGVLNSGEADVTFIVENIATGEVATNATSFRGPSQ